MFKSLYQWMLIKSRHPKAMTWLTGISALESFIFPIPMEVMMVPMALGNREKALRVALFTVIGATIGAAIGYGIGFFFFDAVGKNIIALFDKEAAFTELQAMFNEYDWQVILIAAITPLPFKIATITAGFMQSNFFTYIFAVIVGRGIRYGLVCFLIKLFGERIERFLDQHFTLTVTLGVIVFFAGWIVFV